MPLKPTAVFVSPASAPGRPEEGVSRYEPVRLLPAGVGGRGAARLAQAPVGERGVGEHRWRVACRLRGLVAVIVSGSESSDAPAVVGHPQAHRVGPGHRVLEGGLRGGRVVELAVPVEIPGVGGDRPVRVARARAEKLTVKGTVPLVGEAAATAFGGWLPPPPEVPAV